MNSITGAILVLAGVIVNHNSNFGAVLILIGVLYLINGMAGGYLRLKPRKIKD